MGVARQSDLRVPAPTIVNPKGCMEKKFRPPVENTLLAQRSTRYQGTKVRIRTNLSAFKQIGYSWRVIPIGGRYRSGYAYNTGHLDYQSPLKEFTQRTKLTPEDEAKGFRWSKSDETLTEMGVPPGDYILDDESHDRTYLYKLPSRWSSNGARSMFESGIHMDEEYKNTWMVRYTMAHRQLKQWYTFTPSEMKYFEQRANRRAASYRSYKSCLKDLLHSHALMKSYHKYRMAGWHCVTNEMTEYNGQIGEIYKVMPARMKIQYYSRYYINKIKPITARTVPSDVLVQLKGIPGIWFPSALLTNPPSTSTYRKPYVSKAKKKDVNVFEEF